MAQHIETKHFKTKIIAKIDQSIRKTFARTTPSGSLRWQKLDDLQGGNEVWLTDRYVGKGYVWGDTKACFEVHYNRAMRKIEHIFFVA